MSQLHKKRIVSMSSRVFLKLNKVLLCIILLCSLSTKASVVQDSIAFKPLQTAKAQVPAETLPYKERKFEKDFQDKYSGSDFDYKTKTFKKSAWERFWEWVGAWLSRIFSGSGSAGGGDWVVLFIRILAFVLIGLAVYFITRAMLNKQGYWIFGKASKKIKVQDVAEENIHEMDFGKLVNETKKLGNYKLAVRYYYLWLLKKLSNREVIEWHWQKTNSDYLYEIRDKGLKKDFEYLSYLYDYSWYGDFPIDERAFEKAEKAFQKTLNTL